MKSSGEPHKGEVLLDPFLCALLGDDSSGHSVTVMSAFARLGFNPREAASDISELSAEDAIIRLSGVLANFDDVPALETDLEAIARTLVKLLPNSTQPQFWGVGTQAIQPIITVMSAILVLLLAAGIGLEWLF